MKDKKMTRDEVLNLYFSGWAKTHEVLEHMTMKEFKRLKAKKKLIRQERKKKNYVLDKLF